MEENSNQKKNKNLPSIIAIGFAFLFMTILVVLNIQTKMPDGLPADTSYSTTDPDTVDSSYSENIDSTKSETSMTATLGDKVTLAIPKSSVVLLSKTRGDYKAFIKVAASNDEYGLSDLLSNGQVFSVPKNTSAKVIDVAIGSYEVRVLDGDNVGQSGWVAMEFVHAN